MAIDDDAAGQSRNEESREYEKHEGTEHDKSPVGSGEELNAFFLLYKAFVGIDLVLFSFPGLKSAALTV